MLSCPNAERRPKAKQAISERGRTKARAERAGNRLAPGCARKRAASAASAASAGERERSRPESGPKRRTRPEASVGRTNAKRGLDANAGPATGSGAQGRAQSATKRAHASESERKRSANGRKAPAGPINRWTVERGRTRGTVRRSDRSQAKGRVGRRRGARRSQDRNKPLTRW